MTTRKSSHSSARRRLSYRQKFFDWPVSLFLVLCCGVALAGFTLKVVADDIKVSAKVSAEALTEPAVITNPLNNQRFSSTPIKVSGTCPQNSYVTLTRNNIYSGSVVCQTNNTFLLTIDIVPGANLLQAQDYNITDDPGPVSNPITVYYDQPIAQQKLQASYPPLVLQTEFKYSQFAVNQKIKQTLNISGGNAPYDITVDWGDGGRSKLTLNEAGNFGVEHTYSKAGLLNGAYTVRVTADDTTGQRAFLQYFILITPPQAGAAITSVNGQGGFNIGNAIWPVISTSKLLLIAWPAYAGLTLMAVSYWLGQKEELVIMRRALSHRHR